MNTEIRDRRPKTARLGLLAVLILVMSSIFAVGSEAKPKWASAQDERCESEPLVVDQASDTTLTPIGTRILITQAQCGGPSESNTPMEVVVSVNPTGTHEYVAAVLRGVMYSQSQGSETVRQLELHLPIVQGSNICVTVNGEKHCLPPS